MSKCIHEGFKASPACANNLEFEFPNHNHEGPYSSWRCRTRLMPYKFTDLACNIDSLAKACHTKRSSSEQSNHVALRLRYLLLPWFTKSVGIFRLCFRNGGFHKWMRAAITCRDGYRLTSFISLDGELPMLPSTVSPWLSSRRSQTVSHQMTSVRTPFASADSCRYVFQITSVMFSWRVFVHSAWSIHFSMLLLNQKLLSSMEREVSPKSFEYASNTTICLSPSWHIYSIYSVLSNCAVLIPQFKHRVECNLV